MTPLKKEKNLFEPIFEVFKKTTLIMKETQIPLVASSLAYTTMLSIVPLLAMSFAIFQLFGGLEKLYQMIEPFILSNLASDTGEQTIEVIRKAVGNIRAGALGSTGFIGLIVTCMSMLSRAEKSINMVWKTETQRPLFQRIASYWFFITLGPLAFSFVLALTTSKEMHWVKIFPEKGLTIVLTTAVFFMIYSWIPNCKVNWKSALISSLFTSLLLSLMRMGYSLYIKKVVTYHAVYGSLGAIPIFLIWIYLIWVLVLSGAALGAAIQKQMHINT